MVAADRTFHPVAGHKVRMVPVVHHTEGHNIPAVVGDLRLLLRSNLAERYTVQAVRSPMLKEVVGSRGVAVVGKGRRRDGQEEGKVGG